MDAEHEAGNLATRREISALREFIEAKLDGIHDASTVRYNALEVRFADADQRNRERFEASDLRYQQRYDASDKALTAASLAQQGAVNAALAAAKEAVQAASVSAEKSVAAQNESNAAAILKSEGAVTKQIDGIVTLITSNAKTNDEKFAGINSRLDRGDGVTKGGFDMRTMMIALIFGGITLASQVLPYLRAPNPTPIIQVVPQAGAATTKP